VQVAACDALYWVEGAIVIEEEWPPFTILHALNNHIRCVDVQCHACRLVARLLEHDIRREEQAEASAEAALCPAVVEPFIRATLQAMQNHPENLDIQSSAVSVLFDLTNKSAYVDHLIPGEGIELVARALSLEEGDFPAARILDRLFTRSAEARSIAIERDIFSILLERLQTTEIREKTWRDTNYTTICVFTTICNILNIFLSGDMGDILGQRIGATEGCTKAIVDVIIHNHCRGHNWESGCGRILAHLATFASVDGMLPLHYAAAWHYTFDENDLIFAEQNNEYSLDEADFQVAQMEVIEHLLDVYPEAATVRDGRGRLPLHYAVEAKAPLSVLEALLRAGPATGEELCCQKDDVMLNFPPALMAAVSDCDLESIFVLLRSIPTIMKRQSPPFINLKRKRPA
jgi:hypothetical protein